MTVELQMKSWRWLNSLRKLKLRFLKDPFLIRNTKRFDRGRNMVDARILIQLEQLRETKHIVPAAQAHILLSSPRFRKSHCSVIPQG